MKTNMPKLRFPGFRNAPEWKEKALRRVCEINPSSDGRLPEEFIYIDLESVVDGVLERKREIERSTAPSRAQRVLRDGDVLFQMVRPYQRNNLLCDFIANNNYVASTGYAQLRPYNSSEFIFQILHTDGFVSKVLGKCTGSNYPAINSSALSDITVYVPSPSEQQKIADCLASLDELIVTESRKLDALASYKKGLMQQLFPAEGETVPKLRFPEFRNAPAWEKKRLAEISHSYQGYGFPEKYQGKKSGEYPFYKVSDISKAVINGSLSITESANYISSEVLAVLQAKLVPPDAVIFAKIGEGVRLNRRTITTCKCVIDNNTMGLKAISGKCDDYFLYCILSQIDLIEYAGGVVPSINKSTIENITIFCPSISEQQKIADCLASLDELIAVQTEKLDGLKNFKKGMMQQLFPANSEVTI